MQETLTRHGLHVDAYTAHVPVPESVIAAIVHGSKQDHIRTTTPHDEAVRFTDRKAFYDWFAQGKFLLTLVETDTETLAGIAWFGHKTNALAKNATHTYAHRLYEGFTGQGLSAPFAYEAHILAKRFIGNGPFWLSVHHKNTAAIRTYQKVGYCVVAEQGERRIMVRDEEAA